jgi:hypothetical protein
MDSAGRISQSEHHAALDRRDAELRAIAAERDLLKRRLVRVEELARAPLIDGETAHMQRLVSICVELGITPL